MDQKIPESLQKTTRNDDRDESDTKLDLYSSRKPTKIYLVTKAIPKMV